MISHSRVRQKRSYQSLDPKSPRAASLSSLSNKLKPGRRRRVKSRTELPQDPFLPIRPSATLLPPPSLVSTPVPTEPANGSRSRRTRITIRSTTAERRRPPSPAWEEFEITHQQQAHPLTSIYPLKLHFLPCPCNSPTRTPPPRTQSPTPRPGTQPTPLNSSLIPPPIVLTETTPSSSLR